MMAKETPCRFCSDRVIMCHANCDKYKEYRRIIGEENRVIQKNKEIEDLGYSVQLQKAVFKKWQR